MTEPEQDKVLKIVSRHLDYVIVDPNPDAMTLDIDPETLKVEKFKQLLKDLKKVGFSAFTGGEGSSLLYIIRKREAVHSVLDSHNIKLGLAIVSLGFTIYAGYSYQASYVGNSSFFASIGPVLLLFVVPIALIITAREFGRFLALKRDGIKYAFPILVPDPIFYGTMGSIMGHKEPYVTRGCMLRSGMYPLIFGFITSIAFFVSGILMGSPRVITHVNSPTTTLSLPLLLSTILSGIAPRATSINLLAYAGWVGIMVNSFNAFPLGYLDGGLVMSSLIPSHAKYFSYGSLVTMAIISFFSPAWYILLVFAIIIGLQGAKPLYSLKGLGKKSRVIVLASMLLIVAGIAPIPLHVVPSDFNMSVPQTSFLVVNGSNENLTFTVSIQNDGSSSIVPAFTLSPQLQVSVSSNHTQILPGESASFTILLQTWNLNTLGFHNYTLLAYSGSSELEQQISILNVNLSGPVSFSSSYLYKERVQPNQKFNLTFSYSSESEKNLSVFFFAPDNFTYSVEYNNLSFVLTGPNELFGKPFTHAPGTPMVLTMIGFSDVAELDVVVLTSTYQAAIAEIYLA